MSERLGPFSYKSIASDFDGILCNLRKHIVRLVNTDLKTEYTIGDIRSHDQVKKWYVAAGSSEVEALRIEDYFWYNPDVLLNAPPLPGAYKFVEWAQKNKIPFQIVSTRRPEFRQVTERWINIWMPLIDPKDIFMRTNDEMPGEIFKPLMVCQLGSDLFLEDTPHQAKFVLVYSNADVVLHSNIRIHGLEPQVASRLIQVPETPEIGPDFNAIAGRLKVNYSVAQSY